MNKLHELLDLLINEKPLPGRYADHYAFGNWAGCRDVHLEPDWTLFYEIVSSALNLLRAGSHTRLMKK